MNSLGTVLSETVATVSLSAPVVATTTELSLPSRLESLLEVDKQCIKSANTANTLLIIND